MEEEGGQHQTEQVPVADNSQTATEQPHSSADYGKYSPPPKPSSKWRRWLIWAGIALFVLAILAVAYQVAFKKSKKPSTPTTTQSQTTQSQTAASSATVTTATKNYSSQNFALSFNYPQDWTVTDSGSGILTAKSPAIQMKDSRGATKSLQIYFTIRNKTQKLIEFDAGNAMAERDSTKIAYTKPTQTQRGSTYVSFLRYAKSTSGLNEVCITGDNGYKAAQAIPMVDMTKVDPVICINFWTDATNNKQPVVPVTIASTSWDDPAISAPLLNIFKSLVIA